MQITIEKLVYGGAGMARTEDGVVFVPKVLPGELVEVEIVDRKKDYSNAKIIDIVTPSADRREPECPNFETVGCCGWDHIRYKSQLDLKESIIRESLSRNGRIDWNEPIERVTGPEREYRLRAVLQVRDGQLGFFKVGSHEVVPIERCKALAPVLNEFIAEAVSALASPELGGTETVRVIATPDGKAMSAVFERGRERAPWPGPKPMARIRGIDYQLRPESFFQPNRFLLEPIVAVVVKACQGGHRTLDLFCGSAFFTLQLARECGEVIGVDRRSVRTAAWNAEHNHIDNVRFVKSSAWAFLMKNPPSADRIVLDPPRSGCGKNIIRKVAAMSPKRIVYVSCNPTTFAPEARVLVDSGYRMSELRFLDQFPNTPHIETIAVFDSQ